MLDSEGNKLSKDLGELKGGVDGCITKLKEFVPTGDAGQEVSGGNACDPASGYLFLESEGSPIQFRNLRIRELP